jgi:polyhydroxybutyrate depolymerase
MKKLFTLFSIFVLTFTALQAQYLTGITLQHDGETRVYDVYIPVNYSPSENLPLILNMHGFGGNSQSQASYTEFNSIADTARFIVVYPQGLVRQIDTGQTAAHWNAYFGTDVDDKGFLTKLIDLIINQYSIDESRVYAIGWSNGGYMAYRLACELSNRIAAVASVTGSMVFQQLPNCLPTNAVSVIHIHGTNDETVSYNGSARSLAVSEVITTWVEKNNCLESGVVEENLPDLDPNDNSTVSKFEYNTCTLNTDVHLYKVTGGGHTWPGASIDRPELGVTNRDIKASAVIWNFLKLHRNVNVVTSNEEDPEDKVVVYPAIFEDQIEVSRLPEGSHIKIYSVAGRLVAERANTQMSETFNTSRFHSGVYVMHVQFPGKGYTSMRLIKSR